MIAEHPNSHIQRIGELPTYHTQTIGELPTFHTRTIAELHNYHTQKIGELPTPRHWSRIQKTEEPLTILFILDNRYLDIFFYFSILAFNYKISPSNLFRTAGQKIIFFRSYLDIFYFLNLAFFSIKNNLFFLNLWTIYFLNLVVFKTFKFIEIEFLFFSAHIF